MMGAGGPKQQETGSGGRFRATPAVAPVHAAACSIWDIPADAAPDALLADGVRREDAAAYLSEVRPLFDAARRCLGQLSGLLLLHQTGCLERERGELLLSSATAQLVEARERLRAVRTPALAARHAAALGSLLALLAHVAGRLEERLRDLVDPGSAALDAAVEALFAAQHAFHGVSVPEAGLAPVDFTAACCNCRRPARN